MTDLRDVLWVRAEPTLYITKEEFLSTLDGWIIEGHDVDGELSWITLQKGPEIHFQSIGKTRPMPRGRFCAVVQKIIDEHGYAQTTTPKDDERQHRFNRIFGFRIVGEDEFDTHFRIDRLRHT